MKNVTQVMLCLFLLAICARNSNGLHKHCGKGGSRPVQGWRIHLITTALVPTGSNPDFQPL